MLIAPYAKSVLPVPWSFWEQTAQRYASQGIRSRRSCTATKPRYRGRSRSSFGYRRLLDAVERAGTFIGLRSGLCDLVHTARARKVHVFPDACYSTTSYKVADFFALPGWESVVLPLS